MIDFKTKTITQIRLWAWAAAVLPLGALAGIFFIWAFGLDTWVHIAMTTGATVMFSFAVAWWWWAMYIFRNLMNLWNDTEANMFYVLTHIREIRAMVKEQIDLERDK